MSFIIAGMKNVYATDTTPPVLKSISVSKNSVVAGESLTITIDAEDLGSGISAVWMSLVSPSKQLDPFSGQSISFGAPTSTMARTAVVDYPGGIETGKWRVKISLQDSAGNIQALRCFKWVT
jgi:hypothetical protein